MFFDTWKHDMKDTMWSWCRRFDDGDNDKDKTQILTQHFRGEILWFKTYRNLSKTCWHTSFTINNKPNTFWRIFVQISHFSSNSRQCSRRQVFTAHTCRAWRSWIRTIQASSSDGSRWRHCLVGKSERWRRRRQFNLQQPIVDFFGAEWWFFSVNLKLFLPISMGFELRHERNKRILENTDLTNNGYCQNTTYTYIGLTGNTYM